MLEHMYNYIVVYFVFRITVVKFVYMRHGGSADSDAASQIQAPSSIYYLCEISVNVCFSPGFPPGLLVSSHVPKTCQHLDWLC